MEKQCCKCKEIKNFSNFGKLTSSKDGLRYDCNDCRKLYRKNNKETITQKSKDYYDNHKIILGIKNKEYQTINIIKINKQRKEYRNRPEIKEHIKQKNKEYLPKKKK